MTLVGFLLIYVFGGLTFFPLLGGIILLIIFPPWTWKIKKDSTIKFDSVLLPDHLNINSTGRDDSSYHKYGWLRVTREFDLPNNGTSNRSSIIGNMMKQGITSFMEGQNNNNKQHLKRTKDSFFAVLKYNTLFMYESEKQLDYKGIIIVSNHDVTIFPEQLPDNEIFTKANSIRLTKKPSICAEMALESNSCNYYLFCDTGVEKEDWYFALQRSSKLESNDNSTDQSINRDKSLFDSFAMNHLLKTLYSNDDHIHTQWLNAVLGRIFLSVYKTQAVKDYFIRKLVKKIKKVKKPGFLSDIQIKSVDVGDGIPYITNPELVKLSPDGELNVDINLNYTGGFRVEIETEAILSVGVKTIKVPLVLAVVLRGLQGKMLLRIKSPPTNRLWMGFYDMPKLDLLIEPVVSETQLKFGPFIKAIESKIHEMINDSLVLPNMDDTPFFNSFGMGGIYEGEVEQPKQQTDTLTETPPPTPPSALSSTDSEKETSKLIEEEESVVADIRSTLTTNEEVLKSINSSPAILESTKSDDKVEVTINTPNAPNTPNTPNTPNIPNTPNTSNTPNITENNGPSLSWTSSTATKLKSAFSEPNLLKTNTSRLRSISKQFMKQRADDSSVKDPIKEHVKESDGDINLLSATSNSSSSTTSSTSTLRRWSQSVNIRRRTGIASILNHATYNGKSNNSNNNDNNNKNSDNTTSNTSNSTSNSTESDTQKSQISSMESIPVASLPADPVDSGDNRTTSLLIENFAPLSSSPQNISPSSASPTSVVSSTIITTPSINTSKESLALPTYKSSSLSPTSQNDVPKTTTPTPPPSPPKSPKEPPDIQVNSPHSPPHSSSSTRSSKSTSSYNRDLFLSENNSLHDDEFFPDVTPPILNTPVEELNRVLAKGTEGTVN